MRYHTNNPSFRSIHFPNNPVNPANKMDKCNLKRAFFIFLFSKAGRPLSAISQYRKLPPPKNSLSSEVPGRSASGR